MCHTNGITLIVIPYWWDKQCESIAQTVHVTRPDIEIRSQLLTGVPISSTMPNEHLKQGTAVKSTNNLVLYHPKAIETVDHFGDQC